MRFRSAGTLNAHAIGRRVTVRRTLEEGGTTDVVGVLVALDAEAATVRDRHGHATTVPVAAIVAARIIEAPRKAPRGSSSAG